MPVFNVSNVGGRSFDVESAPDAGSLCAELERTYHYRSGVKVMQDNKVLQATEPVDPRKVVLVIGTTLQKNAPRAASVSPSRQPAPFSVAVVILPGGHRHVLHLTPESTVAELLTAIVAKEPSLHGCRLIFCGHELTDLSRELRQYGIHSDSTVHVVSRTLDGNSLKLMQASQTLSELKSQVADDTPLQIRKGIYEKAMRLLFSLDGMEDLTDEERTQRKNLVKQMQLFQDALLGTHATD